MASRPLPRARSHGDWPPRLTAIAALTLAVCAGWVAVREWQVAQIADAMRGSDADRRAVLARFADRAPAALPLRADAALAQAALRSAAASDNPALRAVWLDRADVLVAYLRSRQPRWLATMLLDCQLDRQHHGAPTSTGLAAFTASYRAQRFARSEAIWRLAYAAAYWSDLPEPTRDAVLDEAAWLVRIDAGLRPTITAALGDTPAGFAFAARRRADAADASRVSI